MVVSRSSSELARLLATLPSCRAGFAPAGDPSLSTAHAKLYLFDFHIFHHASILVEEDVAMIDELPGEALVVTCPELDPPVLLQDERVAPDRLARVEVLDDLPVRHLLLHRVDF